MLKAGIVGLPNVGKSTLFNAITKKHILASNYPFATIEPNVGVVFVNDQRLKELSELYNTKETIYTSFEFMDIAGLVKGASKGEGLGNKFLSHIREVDAICHVVRAFDNKEIIHVENGVDPIRDIEIINLELMLADLEVVQNRLDKIQKKAQSNKDKDLLVEVDVLTKTKEVLIQNKLANTIDYNEEELKLIKGYNLLTIKPVIYVANVSEEFILEDNLYVTKIKEYAGNSPVVKICAKIEEDLNELEDDNEREEFLSSLGILESGLDTLIKTSYKTLNLATFFTAGVKECRAWTFNNGDTAPICAGVIHSDIQRGFIRAEVFNYTDIMMYKNELAVKENGKLRVEGKDYIMKDGDIVYFRFNV